MLWLIAWRNVWRNRKRSATILAAIAFGLWAGLLTAGIMYGMSDQMIRNAISTRLSHIQIHNPGFRAHKDIAKYIPDGQRVLEQVRSTAGVKYAAGRVLVTGMASSAVTGSGVILYGIDPEIEREITQIPEKIVAGVYFGGKRRNPCVIGQALAEKLGIKVGNKLIVTAQSLDGTISGGAFRVVGLFKTSASEWDKSTVFALNSDVDETFGISGQIHEIAVYVEDPSRIDEVRDRLKAAFPALDVEDWQQLSPELAYMNEMATQMVYIFVIIILLALIFGITNTMLMAVLERIRELGVLTALGMKHGKIFLMIMFETLVLAFIGGIIGMTASVVTIHILSRTGINLAIVAKGLESFGMSSVLYPTVPTADYPLIGILVMLTAILASIYPGLKAMRLNPVEAIRTY